MANWTTPHSGTGVVHSTATSLTLQLLAWVACRHRSYAETMDAWRSSCPRLTIWEDALADGLVEVEPAGSGPFGPQAVLTGRGRALLDRS